MGVFIGQSTRVYDREHGEEILFSRVPAGAAVVPDAILPAKNGKYGLSCAVIVKRVLTRRPAPRRIRWAELLRDTD